MGAEFRRNKDIPRIQMNRIEYLLRIGRNRFDMLRESNMVDINVV